MSAGSLLYYKYLFASLKASVSLLSFSDYFFYDSCDNQINIQLKDTANAYPISENDYFHIKNQTVYDNDTNQVNREEFLNGAKAAKEDI